jgi:hypothetical protein
VTITYAKLGPVKYTKIGQTSSPTQFIFLRWKLASPAVQGGAWCSWRVEVATKRNFAPRAFAAGSPPCGMYHAEFGNNTLYSYSQIKPPRNGIYYARVQAHNKQTDALVWGPTVAFNRKGIVIGR